MNRLPLIFALAVIARGQDAISLKEAVRQAMERSKVLEASSASKDAASAQVTQAKSGWLPKANYSESWTRSDNPVFVFSSLLTQRQFGESNLGIASLNRPGFLNNFQSLLTAEQPLYDAGKTRRAVHAAKLGEDLAREGIRRSQLEVIAQVVRFYYDTQLGTEQVKVTTEAMRSAEADLERSEARRSSGMATDADVLSIRVHLAGVREEQIRRSADLDVARAAMNDAMGLPLDAVHVLTTPLVPLSPVETELSGYEKNAIEGRPEARQARLASQIAGVQVADARSRLMPQVALHGAFEVDRQRFVYRGGANWLVSIGLRWNLFNGGADKAKIAESEAAVRRTTAQQALADSGIRLQVRRAWAAFKAAQQRIETTQASVAEAQESLRISRNRFAAGLSTVTDLLRTETALLETQTRFLAAVHDQRIAAAMLEFAAGTLSPDSEVLN
ncbi:MAG TPA: TolC family protein [Bryobacteraceae bacterium]|nr:TolC family protein [Bryobacteraceae bacterium]